jgi:serine phosphatase RsbU (regulator of sigma subunit)/CHASE2 domain-containing sensor protein
MLSRRLLKAIFFGLIIGILGLLAGFSQTISRLDENSGLGLLFKLRGHRTPPSDIVVVSIDKESSDELGLPNNPDKWPRSVHARLVPILAKAGAAVTAFDVHFIEARDSAVDALFADAIKKAGNVVLCEPMIAKEIPVSKKGGAAAAVHSIEKRVMPLALFADACVATAPFALPRIPFKVNQYWAFKTGAGDSPTLPVVAFQLYTAAVYEPFLKLLKEASPQWASKLPKTIDDAVKTGGVKTLISNIRGIFKVDPQVEKRMMTALKQSSNGITDERKSRLIQSLIHMYGGSNRRYINYYGPPRTITTLPYYRALQIGQAGQQAPEITIKGKAVFVGLSEVLLAERKDSFYTVYSQANGVFISGVEIAATAMANILENTPVRPIPIVFYVILILLWGTGLGIVCRLYPVLISASVVVGASILYLVSSVLQFKFFDLWYPIIIPVVLQAPLAFLGSAGIKYGILFKEFLVKQRMEEDLSSARDLQASMLPAECPVIEGYQLAAKSTPAREVGGDFFDFFEIGEDRMGLAIGDVTGKSVSGALVMSASRSIFRMLSEEDFTVADIMIRANRRTKKDIKSGMFVALLFAMLDNKEKLLSICSAGQTQPIHYVAETGEAKLVETEGDSFPLGILDDPDYQETYIQLNPGDKIMFYTDGIVEAMNAKEEMFGFERLLEIMQHAGDKDAESLLNETIEHVNTFAGNVPQHDDLTIIVLGVSR